MGLKRVRFHVRITAEIDFSLKSCYNIFYLVPLQEKMMLLR